MLHSCPHAHRGPGNHWQCRLSTCAPCQSKPCFRQARTTGSTCSLSFIDHSLVCSARSCSIQPTFQHAQQNNPTHSILCARPQLIPHVTVCRSEPHATILAPSNHTVTCVLRHANRTAVHPACQQQHAASCVFGSSAQQVHGLHLQVDSAHNRVHHLSRLLVLLILSSSGIVVSIGLHNTRQCTGGSKRVSFGSSSQNANTRCSAHDGMWCWSVVFLSNVNTVFFLPSRDPTCRSTPKAVTYIHAHTQSPS